MADASDRAAEAEPETPPYLEERFRARRRGIVKVLRVLCALPALLLLYHALFPKVTYTYRITLSTPATAPVETLELGAVRLEPRDRALALVPIDDQGKERAGAPRVVVRNNVRSDAPYRRLAELDRGGRFFLSLKAPKDHPETLLPQDSWPLSIDTTSDYSKQLSHRVFGLLLGLVLVALAALFIPRLVHVLWPER